jgi:hypothetical protein
MTRPKRKWEPIGFGRDGREVCRNRTKEGRDEYKKRTAAMVERQKGICCLYGYSPVCHPRGILAGYIPTFDHEYGRGMNGGKRDDRIVLPDGTWINGACHALCNQWKGSRYIDYNRSFQK